MTINKKRLEKLEKIMGNKKNMVYVIDPFAEHGQEVIVSGAGVERHTISIEEFEKLDTQDDMVISFEFV